MVAVADELMHGFATRGVEACSHRSAIGTPRTRESHPVNLGVEPPCDRETDGRAQVAWSIRFPARFDVRTQLFTVEFNEVLVLELGPFRLDRGCRRLKHRPDRLGCFAQFPCFRPADRNGWSHGED